MIDKFMSQLTLPPPIFLTKILDRICTDLRNNPGGCQIRGKLRIRGTLTCLLDEPEMMKVLLLT